MIKITKGVCGQQGNKVQGLVSGFFNIRLFLYMNFLNTTHRTKIGNLLKGRMSDFRIFIEQVLSGP